MDPLKVRINKSKLSKTKSLNEGLTRLFSLRNKRQKSGNNVFACVCVYKFVC